MPLPLANATALPAALPRAEPGTLRRADGVAISGATIGAIAKGGGAGATLEPAREQANAKKESPILRDEANKPQRLTQKDNPATQPSLNALALALAEDQNLSREQSLALGSYLQTQSLSAEPVDSVREQLVGVDTFA